MIKHLSQPMETQCCLEPHSEYWIFCFVHHQPLVWYDCAIAPMNFLCFVKINWETVFKNHLSFKARHWFYSTCLRYANMTCIFENWVDDLDYIENIGNLSYKIRYQERERESTRHKSITWNWDCTRFFLMCELPPYATSYYVSCKLIAAR